MTTINIKSDIGEADVIERFVADGLKEELRKIEFAISRTSKNMEYYEQRFSMSTEDFLQKYGAGEIEEREEYFTWWAEKKLYDSLMANLQTVKSIRICQP